MEMEMEMEMVVLRETPCRFLFLPPLKRLSLEERTIRRKFGICRRENRQVQVGGATPQKFITQVP